MAHIHWYGPHLHWFHWHWLHWHCHPVCLPCDVLMFGCGAIATFYGALATADPIEFSGLNSLIVSLTGLAGCIITGMMRWQSLRIEEIKLRAGDNTQRIAELEGELVKTKEESAQAKRDAIEAKAQADAMHVQLEKTRANFHKTTNIVTEMDLERQMKKLTPDPDRSGPQKVVVVNDEQHPVPTAPGQPPEGGRP